MEQERTQFISLAAIDAASAADRRHCLEWVSGAETGRRYHVGPSPVICGRTAPADIAIPEAAVSRRHCALAMDGGEMIVTDLASTNGTWIDGVQVTRPTPLKAGGLLQVGSQVFKHELLTGKQLQKSDELERELAAAFSYVQALLPRSIDDAAIKANWVYQPCTRLGGDVFGYGYLSKSLFNCYLVDVSGHGAGAAMHGVAVMNALRQRALPDTDMTHPGKVLETLNTLFQMDRHADMYFTIWYGVYDCVARTLTYASGGHHPAFLVPPDRLDATPMRTRNAFIGAVPGKTYTCATMTVPPAASVYLFSDGVFEIITGEGREWGLADFVPLILARPEPGVTESERLYRKVRGASRTTDLDDDFSLVVLTFD